MKTRTFGNEAKSVLESLRRIVHSIHARHATIEGALGITGAQLWALREIDASVGGIALKELARKLALHPANAGRLVERLVAKKLVSSERPPNDRRYVVVEITGKGRALARNSVSSPAQADLLERLGDLSPDELEGLDASLKRLVSLLGAEAVEPSPLFDEAPAKRRARRK